MRFGKISVSLVALAFLGTVSAFGAVRSCKVGEPSPASYTWNFEQEAVELMEEVRWHTAAIRSESNQLTALARNPKVSWQTHAAYLGRTREHVNAISDTMCRLGEIRHMTAPWQQQAIDNLRLSLAQIANHANLAIEQLNANKSALYATDFSRTVNSLHATAVQFNSTMRDFVDYGRAREDVERLEGRLEIAALR